MKNIQCIPAVLLLTITIISCSGNGAPGGNEGNAAVTAASAGNVSSDVATANDDASFSCMLDGKDFSGKGADQNINVAFHLTGDNKGQVFFRLSDLNDPGQKLMFQVPAKEGSTNFSATPTYSYGGYITGDFATYIDDPVTVTINSISSSRVSGTFSGKYTFQKGSGNSNSKQTIEVTDGKFDIPFSTSADWKKMYNAE